MELHNSSTVKAITKMEVVSPLVRSIFESRKKMILDASQKTITSKKDQVGRGIQSQTKQIPHKDREHLKVESDLSEKATLNKKAQVLDEEIVIFKKENKRVKNLAKVSKLMLFEPSKFFVKVCGEGTMTLLPMCKNWRICLCKLMKHCIEQLVYCKILHMTYVKLGYPCVL